MYCAFELPSGHKCINLITVLSPSFEALSLLEEVDEEHPAKTKTINKATDNIADIAFLRNIKSTPYTILFTNFFLTNKV